MPTINLEIDSNVFNAVYLPYLNDETYHQIFFGGSSSGKSYFLAQRCVLDVAKGGHNYLITRKVARTLRGSVFNEVKKAIRFFCLSPYFKINESDMIITCHNGYQILFAGLDDVEKIKSITPAKEVLTDIWNEECTENDYNDIKQLEKRLRGASSVKKRMIDSFNPILQEHWLYKENFNGWDDSKREYKSDNLTILKTTYKDNKFLTQEDIYRLENEKDPYYRNVYTFGNWGVLGGVIFKNWHVEDLTDIKDTFDRYYNGLDFGFAEDPAAIIRIHYDKMRKKIYIVNEFAETGMTNDMLANQIQSMIGKNELITCDSAEPKSIHELSLRGIAAIPAKKGKDSVNFGIQWLQQHEIIVDVSCQQVKNELQSYKWREDKDGNILPEPLDKNNHLIDAMRYALEIYMTPYKEAQEKPIDIKDKYRARYGIQLKRIQTKAGSL